MPRDDIFIKFRMTTARPKSAVAYGMVSFASLTVKGEEMASDLDQNIITIPISMDRAWAKSLLQLVERKDACFENMKKATDSRYTADNPEAYLEAKQMEVSYQADYNKLVMQLDEYRINMGTACITALLEYVRQHP